MQPDGTTLETIALRKKLRNAYACALVAITICAGIVVCIFTSLQKQQTDLSHTVETLQWDLRETQKALKVSQAGQTEAMRLYQQLQAEQATQKHE